MQRQSATTHRGRIQRVAYNTQPCWLAAFDCCRWLSMVVICRRPSPQSYNRSHPLVLLYLLPLIPATAATAVTAAAAAAAAAVAAVGIERLMRLETAGRCATRVFLSPHSLWCCRVHFVCYLNHGVSRRKRTYYAFAASLFGSVSSLTSCYIVVSVSCRCEHAIC